MKYDDYLLKVLKDTCPFCDINKDYIVEKGKYFDVILSRAPYVKDHVLVVPHRHIIRMREITAEERGTLFPLIDKWIKKMENVHDEVNLLLRDGVANGMVGKSINHLHFHIVPGVPVYSINSGGNREIYTDYQLVKETATFKSKFKGK